MTSSLDVGRNNVEMEMEELYVTLSVNDTPTERSCGDFFSFVSKNWIRLEGVTTQQRECYIYALNESLWKR